MRIADIKPNPANPRRISEAALERLAESIRRDPEFMAIRPIVVNADGIILGGNQHYEAIKKLGMSEIPDEWVRNAADLPPDKARRFILADNAPSGMAGEWQIDLLLEEYEPPELEELGFDLQDMGIELPDFAPGTADEQGRLDQLEPKIVKCPDCGKEFDAREQM